MSLILDALKKSEERRQQDQPPPGRKRVLALETGHSRRWLLWLILILLPLGLFGGWWLGKNFTPAPGSQQQVDTRVLAELEGLATESPEVGPAVPAPPQLRQEDEPAPPAVAQEAIVATAAPAPVPARAPPAEAVPNKRSSGEQDAPAEETASATAPATEQADRAEAAAAPNYADLSPQLRSRLPRLQVSLHFYSTDPARRMVRLDNQLLHEGDLVADGLTVREITPQGLVLNFEGLDFTLPKP